MIDFWKNREKQLQLVAGPMLAQYDFGVGPPKVRATNEDELVQLKRRTDLSREA